MNGGKGLLKRWGEVVFSCCNDGAHRNLLYSRVLQRERLLKLQKGMGRQTRSGKRAVKCIQKSDVMREVERGTFLPLPSPAVYQHP